MLHTQLYNLGTDLAVAVVRLHASCMARHLRHSCFFDYHAVAESEDNLDTWQPESMAGVPSQPATQQPWTQQPNDTQLPQTQQHFLASPGYDMVRTTMMSAYLQIKICHEGHNAIVWVSGQLRPSLISPLMYMQLTQQCQDQFVGNENPVPVPNQQAHYGRNIPVGGGA